MKECVKNPTQAILLSQFDLLKLCISKVALYRTWEEVGHETGLQLQVAAVCGSPFTSCVTLAKSPNTSGPTNNKGD